jgi:hypothetical protein
MLLTTGAVTNFFQEHLQRISVNYDYVKADIPGGLSHLGITLSSVLAMAFFLTFTRIVYYRSPRMCRNRRKPIDFVLATIARRNRIRMNFLNEEDKQVDPEITVYFCTYDSETEDPEMSKLHKDLKAEERAIERDPKSVFSMRIKNSVNRHEKDD